MFTFLLFTALLVHTANAEIFVTDDGTRLAVSWSSTDAFYYKVIVDDLTNDVTGIKEETVFDPFIVIDGLTFHNIYKIIVKAIDKSESPSDIGLKYITFALDETSGNCICNCPEIPKKTFLGVVSENFYTYMSFNNSSSESQIINLKIGTVTERIIVSSNAAKLLLLNDIVEGEGVYPISFETDSGTEVGITLMLYDFLSGTFSTQN